MENTVTKDEVRLRYLMPFLPQSLLVRLFVLRVPSPSELEDGDRVWDEAPVIKWETVSDLLHPLNVHKSMGLEGIHTRVLKERVEVLNKPLWWEDFSNDLKCRAQVSLSALKFQVVAHNKEREGYRELHIGLCPTWDCYKWQKGFKIIK